MKLTCVDENCVAYGTSLWAEHGLSFWIETDDGVVLWDTGQTEAVLEHNIKALGLDLTRVDAIALSHAHTDHTGGILAVLRQVTPPIYAHTTIFNERYSLRSDPPKPAGVFPHRAEIEAIAEMRLSADPVEILPQIRTTGTIAPRPYPAGASKTQAVPGPDGWLPDPYLDDMSLVLMVEGGIVLLCGCCHSGLRNTIRTVRAQYDEKLVAILGGTHLRDISDEEMQAIIQLLKDEGSPTIYLNHCTGEKALGALRKVFGDLVCSCSAGDTIAF